MCTASWASIGSRTQIVFNRDERHSRKAGLPPVIDESNGVKFISPRDGDFGGTWLGVNEYGCVFGLLNFYPKPAPALPEDKLSRGFIITEIAWAKSIEACIDQIKKLSLNRFEPFELLFLTVELSGFIARWDGNALSFRYDLDRELPLSSSSFVTSEIVRYRRAYFNELKNSGKFANDIEVQNTFHFEKPHLNSSYNPLMHRFEARTVSISRISISDERINFEYIPIKKRGSYPKSVKVELARVK